MAKSSFWDDLGNALTRKAKGLSAKAENLYEIRRSAINFLHRSV